MSHFNYLETKEVKYNFAKGNYIEINSELSKINWNSYFNNATDLNNIVDIFIDKINYLIEKYIPKKMNRKRNSHGGLAII